MKTGQCFHTTNGNMNKQTNTIESGCGSKK